MLQRDLDESNIEFDKAEVRILGDVGADGMRRGWAIEVRRWRWA